MPPTGCKGNICHLLGAKAAYATLLGARAAYATYWVRGQHMPPYWMRRQHMRSINTAFLLLFIMTRAYLLQIMVVDP